jgi:hypothetical protein
MAKLTLSSGPQADVSTLSREYAKLFRSRCSALQLTVYITQTVFIYLRFYDTCLVG